MLQFLREAELRRSAIMKPQEVTDEIRHAIQEGYEVYSKPETQQLVARAYAYTSDKAHKAFQDAWYSDQKLWHLAERNIKDVDLKISDELREAIEDADRTTVQFYANARHDLQAFR